MTTIMPTTTDRKAQTHDRILEVAARAIRRGGYDGTGVADLMKEAGLTHGGFYAHFASRDAMLVEALQRAGRDSDALVAERIAQRRAEGESAFSAVVNNYLQESHLAGVERGCTVAALSSEMSRQKDAVLDASRARTLALIELVRRALPEGVAPEQAPVITATMVGSLQIARTLGGKAGKAVLASARQTLIEQYDHSRSRNQQS
jgi:AcrR family transcriptional regulator